MWADWGLCLVQGWALQWAQWVQIAHRQDWMAAYWLRGPHLSQDLGWSTDPAVSLCVSAAKRHRGVSSRGSTAERHERQREVFALLNNLPVTHFSDSLQPAW